MSNHSGSYLLNEVLLLLEKEGVFERLGKDRARQIVLKVIKKAQYFDCNDGEILEGIGERLGICYCCLKKTTSLKDGLCKTCRDEFGEDE